MRPINSPQQVGAVLASRRKALGLSQATLASKLGISQGRVSELEAQTETLTIARLLALLNLLGLELTIAERNGNKSSTKIEW